MIGVSAKPLRRRSSYLEGPSLPCQRSVQDPALRKTAAANNNATVTMVVNQRSWVEGV